MFKVKCTLSLDVPSNPKRYMHEITDPDGILSFKVVYQVTKKRKKIVHIASKHLHRDVGSQVYSRLVLLDHVFTFLGSPSCYINILGKARR